jgi:hypothetical protein
LIIRKKKGGGPGGRVGKPILSPEGIFGSFESKFHVTLIPFPSKKIQEVKTPNQQAKAMDDRPKALQPYLKLVAVSNNCYCRGLTKNMINILWKKNW